MEVGFGNVRNTDARVPRSGFHPVNVSLGINYQSHIAVVHKVAAVAQRRSFDDDDIHDSGYR
ncbi:hypothetical protein StoSoilB22_30930 [Arthrobacter sp. StoSoilB22]|nr:hypothetical protein StoSoilB22_30930 [Arthrobacter sp. StoSoilB22]